LHSTFHDELAVFCRTHSITRLWIFGSALREDFGPESDVDVIIAFEPGHAPGLRFFELADELSDIFGRPVDVVSRAGLRGPLGERILRDAVEVYGRD
jgi:predicted nucleotidyltransferase